MDRPITVNQLAGISDLWERQDLIPKKLFNEVALPSE